MSLQVGRAVRVCVCVCVWIARLVWGKSNLLAQLSHSEWFVYCLFVWNICVNSRTNSVCVWIHFQYTHTHTHTRARTHNGDWSVMCIHICVQKKRANFRAWNLRLTVLCVTWLTHVRNMTHSKKCHMHHVRDVTHSHVRHDSFKRATCRLHVCHDTYTPRICGKQWCVWRDPSMCATWLTLKCHVPHMCDATHWHVRYDSCKCATCMICVTRLMCDSYVRHDWLSMSPWVAHNVRHDSFTSVTHTCHTHLSRTLVTNTCHTHLSRALVTNTCHTHLSRTLVTHTCHEHLSHTLVTNTCHTYL